MVERILFSHGGASEVKQDEILAALALAIAELQTKFQEGQAVALDAGTLAALANVTATVTNFPADYPDAAALNALAAIVALLGGTLTVADGHPDPQQDGLTDAQLRASDVKTADDYDLELVTVDQAGLGAVLTFSLGQAAPLVTVDVDPEDPEDTTSYMCRVRLDGTDPTATSGHRCRSGQTTYLPFPSPTGAVKVYAPTGVTVSVQGGGRT